MEKQIGSLSQADHINMDRFLAMLLTRFKQDALQKNSLSNAWPTSSQRLTSQTMARRGTGSSKGENISP